MLAAWSYSAVSCDVHTERNMFLFFSSRLGCLGSILVSIILTLALLLLFGVI